MKLMKFIRSIMGDQTPASDIAESILNDKSFPKDKSEDEMLSYIKYKTAGNSTIFATTEESNKNAMMFLLNKLGFKKIGKTY